MWPRYLLCLLAIAWSFTALAEPVRLAVFNVALDRKGPGLLLRDILAGDAQAEAAARVIAAADADAIVLVRFDYDHGGAALSAFAAVIAGVGGPDYRHRYALMPNAGRATGLDLDGDGRRGGPGDAMGYGAFSGQGGLAMLSRYPVDPEGAVDYSGFLWRDLPDARWPRTAEGSFYDEAAKETLPLASTAAWSLPLILPDGGRLSVLAFHASPPVFDGPEDRNGLRNADEIRFWRLLLSGRLPLPAPDDFVILANANLDPARGDGRRDVMAGLLADPRLQDPRPVAPADESRAADATGLWSESDGPGPLRVEYALPSAGLAVLGSGLLGPPDNPELAATFAERDLPIPLHRLVWLELDWP